MNTKYNIHGGTCIWQSLPGSSGYLCVIFQNPLPFRRLSVPGFGGHLYGFKEDDIAAVEKIRNWEFVIWNQELGN
jgi:hypothetical protein